MLLQYRGVNYPPRPHPPLLFEVKTRIFWGKGDLASLLLCQAVSITCLLWAEPIRGRSSALLSQFAAANPLLPQHISLGKQRTAELVSESKAAECSPHHPMLWHLLIDYSYRWRGWLCLVYGLKAIKGDFRVGAKGQLMCCSWKFFGDTCSKNLESSYL